MARIRADFVGSLIVHAVDRPESFLLVAGDEVPEGVRVADDLVEAVTAPASKRGGGRARKSQ